MKPFASDVGRSGMVLCAGLGSRMLPLTNTTPKPLISVAGKPLMAHAIDQLENNGVNDIVVNVHYLADQVETWVAKRTGSTIEISDEREELLETGGGVVKAGPLLGSAPFFVLNSDAFWLDKYGTPTLEQMRSMFDAKDCDFLLLLAPREKAVGYHGKGDFFCSKDAKLTRRGNCAHAPYVFAGCYIIHPRVLTNYPEGAFSMNFLWDRALETGRIWGLVLDGLWLHVGTPQAIGDAEQAIKEFQSNQK